MTNWMIKKLITFGRVVQGIALNARRGISVSYRRGRLPLILMKGTSPTNPTIAGFITESNCNWVRARNKMRVCLALDEHRVGIASAGM